MSIMIWLILHSFFVIFSIWYLSIMRRNLISFLKFLLLSLCAVLLTIFIFKIVRPYTIITEDRNHNDDYNNIIHLPFKNLNAKKIDWHDYKKIQRDKEQQGIGENGKPAKLSSSEKDLEEKLYKENGFNGALSDKISLHRSIPDIRHPGCQKKNYSSILPSVSVVVPFHDEHWSTLLRTAHSVIDRSPPQLLKEIILVDDFSSKEFLKSKLDDYVKANFTNVQVVRLPSRQGLILARLAGAKIATGDVLLFLDSHTEANVNWLPPLLEPIAENYKTCVCPFIDVIAHETFEYRAQDEGARGAFDWEFYYKRLPLLEEDKKHPTEPFKSPIMAGGLFAISTKWFWELGGYDEGLDIWGGEQYELSFKIWQCGGIMLDAPCSRVGHIYRKFAPFPNPGHGDFIGKNYKRVAEVWMDEYKEYIYKRKPHYRDIDPGDLTAQKSIRTKLNCKPFRWFMKEVAFDLPKKYPPIEPEDFASGEIRSMFAPELCVDTKKYAADQRFGVELCVSDNGNNDNSYSHEQSFQLGWHRDIRPKGRNMCWDVADPNDKAAVNLFSCHGYGGNQLWHYKPNKNWLVHGGNPRCLDLDPVKRLIFVTKCDEKSETQKWKISSVNLKQLAFWDDPSKLLEEFL